MFVSFEEDEAPKKPHIPFVGLQNMGNTCYLNSILQVLCFCPSFIDGLNELEQVINKRSESDNEEHSGVFKFIKELNNLFENMSERQEDLISRLEPNDDNKSSECEGYFSGHIRPAEFIDCFRNLHPLFEAYTQQDAQECLHSILNSCGEAVKALKSSNDEMVKILPKPSHEKVCGGKKLGGETEVATTSQTINQQKHVMGKEIVAQKHLLTKPVLGVKKQTLVTTPEGNGCLRGLKRRRVQSLSDEIDSDKENFHSGQEKFDSDVPLCKKKHLQSQDPVKVEPAKKKFKLKGFKNFLVKKKYVVTNDVKDKPSADTTVFKTGNPSILINKLNEFQLNKLAKLPFKTDHVREEKTRDFVGELFHGKLVTTVRCCECESEFIRSEAFQDISLPVKHSPDSSNEFEESKFWNESTHCSLDWALEEFTARETLEGDNKYFCDKCKRLCEGEQRVELDKLPPVLTFHLKRFSASCNDNFMTSVSKITSAIEIPSTMKLEKWCTEQCPNKECEYELFAMVVHSGVTITTGHYLSFVKYNNTSDCAKMDEYSDKWFEMDDEEAKLLDDETIQRVLDGSFDNQTRSPYLLFYQRKS